ncbi:MAG: apolipoprotein N-acyltransferase [Bacteroidia bacterium]
MALKKSSLLILAFLFALLLWMAWPARGFAPLLFIAWIPLLIIENIFFENTQLKKRYFFSLTYLAFFLFNLFTTWWIVYSTLFGAVMAVIFNALFMALVFFIFHLVHRKFKDNWIYAALPVLWITWEWLHLDWDLSWPWLMMGNGFAAYIHIVQWYEYTGVLGGTLWVLVANILLFLFWKAYRDKKLFDRKIFAVALSWIIFPIALSLLIYYSYEEKSDPVNVVILQPNIDPYNEKFGGMSSEEQLKKMLSISSSYVDSTTDYLIGPETSIPNAVWEEKLSVNPQIRFLKLFLKKFPHLNLVTGISTDHFYPDGSPHSATARKFTDSDDLYDSYNTAMQLDSSDRIQLYHKSKLVPGVEKMPFPAVFKSIEKFAIDLGGASGSLGVQDEPSVFHNQQNKKYKVAPIICYESIYGEYISRYVRKGASLLFIITNDGWWDDSPGYRQHFQYGRLRAIEMRRSIARSANTGISAVINQRGDVLQQTQWWVPAVLKATINANDELTFYAKHGDYLAKLCAALSVLILLCAVFIRKRLGQLSES